MRYRLTCLTPLLVGDGRRLSPIDYMVWKDHVNVLDQRRIFRLLAKGPRLDGYLTQLKRADKLDFASWGGFAQNFADRRIPFEDPASTGYWQRATGDSIQIPTFSSGIAGPYLPGSAIKGVLRTGMMFMGLRENLLSEVAARLEAGRAPRNPAEGPEEHVLGSAGASRMRALAVADSAPVDNSQFKIYMLRVATLESRGGGLTLAWKLSPRGTVDGRRPEESTPWFAEMATPGTVFEGEWQEREFFSRPEVWRSLRWNGPVDRTRVFRAANAYAAELIASQKQYAGWTGLQGVAESLASVENRLNEAGQAPGAACLLSIGWGTGMLAKTPWVKTDTEQYQQVLRQTPLYERPLKSGLPFPKTRRVVFLGNKPATLPGWALLEIA